MSTRCTTHFRHGKHTEAIIYRHSDGYPDGAGVDIRRFFKRLKDHVPDNRFHDPAYLAAKYVVFLVETMRADMEEFYKRIEETPKAKDTLDFLSVGVCKTDPGDIEYQYVVDCSKVTEDGPSLKCYDVCEGRKLVEIPAIPTEVSK